MNDVKKCSQHLSWLSVWNDCTMCDHCISLSWLRVYNVSALGEKHTTSNLDGVYVRKYNCDILVPVYTIKLWSQAPGFGRREDIFSLSLWDSCYQYWILLKISLPGFNNPLMYGEYVLLRLLLRFRQDFIFWNWDGYTDKIIRCSYSHRLQKWYYEALKIRYWKGN